MAWPLALLGVLVGLGLWAPRKKDRRLVIAIAVIVVVLAYVYTGLGAPPPIAQAG